LLKDRITSIQGPGDDASFHASWKGDFIESVLISDVGKKRRNNEDSCALYVPLEENLLQSRGMLFAVADGMGGASAGEYASRMALEYASERYYENPTMTAIPQQMKKAVEHANALIFRESERKLEYAGMGTTLSAMAILGDWAYIAQVGDSRLYLSRQNEGLLQITYDHSLVAEQLRSGLIDETGAQNHALRNLITRAVGIGEDIEVDLFALGLKECDTLLLCSDGLSNMVPDQVISEYLQQDALEEASLGLLQHALDAGGQDNITLVTVRIIDAPPCTKYQPGARLAPPSKGGLFSRILSGLRRRDS